MSINLRGEIPEDQGAVGEVGVNAAAICAAQGMSEGQAHTYALRGAEYAAQLTLLALRNIGVIPEEGIDYERFTAAVQELTRIAVSSRISEVSDGRTVSQQVLFERMAFSEASRCLAHLLNADTHGQNDISLNTEYVRPRLERVALLFRFPENNVPDASYLESMLNLFPSTEGETMQEALSRIKVRAEVLVGIIESLSSGKFVSRKDLVRLDEAIFKAYQITIFDKHFGEVGIQHSADESRS